MVVGNAAIPLHPTELVVGPKVNVIIRSHARMTIGACTPNFHTSAMTVDFDQMQWASTRGPINA